MIKMYNFKEQYQSIKSEIDYSLQSVLNDTAFSSGKYVEKFEIDFSKYIGANYCVAVNNGTSALHAALLALNIKKNDVTINQSNPSSSFFFIRITNSRSVRVTTFSPKSSGYSFPTSLTDFDIIF